MGIPKANAFLRQDSFNRDEISWLMRYTMTCILLRCMQQPAVCNLTVPEYERGKDTLGLFVVSVQKHKPSLKGRAGLVLDKPVKALTDRYVEIVRPLILGRDLRCL